MHKHETGTPHQPLHRRPCMYLPMCLSLVAFSLSQPQICLNYFPTFSFPLLPVLPFLLLYKTFPCHIVVARTSGLVVKILWWWENGGSGGGWVWQSMSVPDRSRAAYTVSKRAEPSLLINPRAAQSPKVRDLWKPLFSQSVSTLSSLLTLPTASLPSSLQLNHSQLRSYRRRRLRYESRGWSHTLISNKCDWFLLCGFSFPLVREHTRTHWHTLSHSQQGICTPKGELPCSVRVKPASQEQEMKEQTQILAAFCHCKHQPKHTLTFTVAYVHPQLELVKTQTAGPACLCQKSDVAYKVMAWTFSCVCVFPCVHVYIDWQQGHWAMVTRRPQAPVFSHYPFLLQVTTRNACWVGRKSKRET